MWTTPNLFNPWIYLIQIIGDHSTSLIQDFTISKICFIVPYIHIPLDMCTTVFLFRYMFALYCCWRKYLGLGGPLLKIKNIRSSYVYPLSNLISEQWNEWELICRAQKHRFSNIHHESTFWADINNWLYLRCKNSNNSKKPITLRTLSSID